MQRQVVARYSAPAQVLHWLTAVFVLIAFSYGPGGSEERVYSAARDFQRQLHETLGLTVLGLVALRVLWRAVSSQPEPVPMARWMHTAAKVTQTLLYSLLFAVPLTAIAGAWLEGHPLTVLGGLSIPAMLGTSHAVGSRIASLHTWLGDAILWIAGFHALAGLYHHFVIKDGVLLSMLPGREPGERH